MYPVGCAELTAVLASLLQSRKTSYDLATADVGEL